MKRIFLVVFVLLMSVCNLIAQKTNVIEQNLQHEIELAQGELIKINILVHTEKEAQSTHDDVVPTLSRRTKAIIRQKIG